MSEIPESVRLALEEADRVIAGDTVMQLVKVRYISESGLSSREYTYYSEDNLKTGDVVLVPVRDTTCKAKVSSVDVPESEIQIFKDKVKVIPAGSVMPFESQPEPKTETPPLQEQDDMSAVGVTTGEIGLAVSVTEIPPEKNPLVLSIKERGERALEYAVKFVISGPADVKKATTDLALIKGLKDALEENRKEYVKPLNDRVRDINALFKEISGPVLKADGVLRQKVLDYNADVERQRQEAAEKDEEKLRIAREQAAANGGEFTVDLTPEPAPPETPKTVRSDFGSSSQSGTWTYEVEDFSQVPDIYKLLNTAVVNAFVKSNKDKASIPGIKTIFKPGLRVNTR